LFGDGECILLRNVDFISADYETSALQNIKILRKYTRFYFCYIAIFLDKRLKKLKLKFWNNFPLAPKMYPHRRNTVHDDRISTIIEVC
jgi:hypothetical protein